MIPMEKLDLERFRGERGQIHCVGVAGVGTLPLAQIFLENGFRVSGSDLLSTPGTEALRAAGGTVYKGHSADHLPSPEKDLLLIHTSAATPENPELAAASARSNAVLLRRGNALAVLATLYKRVVSVSGSHGKTSVSGLLAYLFREAGLHPGYLVGGFLTGEEGRNGEAGQGNDLFVTEVDESDGTHTAMFSHIGIVTNVEDDHAWSVGGAEQLYANFQQYARQAKTLIYVGSPRTDALFADHPNALRLDPDLAVHQADLALFDPETLACWGSWQKLNAITALAAAKAIGLDPAQAAAILSRFPGVERRMSLRFKNENFTIMEDYAHHPTELRASLTAFREIFPDRRLIVLFQPHRYARLERYFTEFAEVLTLADRVFVTPVFAAWTASGKYTSADLAAAIGAKANAVTGSWEEIAQDIAGTLQAGDLIAVIGAGDLKDVIEPLKKRLN